MERYNEYKDSGVQWLGEIPSHWEVCKVKHHYKMITGFTPSTGKSEYYSNNSDNTWVTIADMKTKFISESSSHISDLYIKNFKPTIVPKGSLLYSFKLSVGQVAFADKDLYTNEAISSFENNENVCLGFLFYSASLCIIKNANTNIYGAFILNQELIKNATIVYPPFAEQKAIANYLDTATAKIDEAIAQQQKMIDLLNERKQIIINNAVTKGLNPDAPMKDSGVDWIGEIPEHWEVMKLKHVTSKIGSGSTPRGGAEVYQDSGIMFLRSQNVYNDGLKLDDVAHIVDGVHQKMKGTQVKYNDILYNITGGSIGRCCCYDREDEANVNQHVSIVRPKGIIAKYLMYNLQSDNAQRQLRETLKGGNREGLAAVTFKEFLILTCPKEEQNQIVSHIERMFVNIDRAISNATKQISLLQERKQIIINDVVTGKVKVS